MFKRVVYSEVFFPFKRGDIRSLIKHLGVPPYSKPQIEGMVETQTISKCTLGYPICPYT